MKVSADKMDKEKSKKSAFELLVEFARERGILDEEKKVTEKTKSSESAAFGAEARREIVDEVM